MLELSLVILCASMGGTVNILHALRMGSVRQNHARRITTDIVGGTIVGTFCGYVLMTKGADPMFRYAVAFISGLSWSQVVEIMKSRLGYLLFGVSVLDTGIQMPASGDRVESQQQTTIASTRGNRSESIPRQPSAVHSATGVSPRETKHSPECEAGVQPIA